MAKTFFERHIKEICGPDALIPCNHRRAQSKTRTVTFNIEYMDETDEEAFREMSIDVTFDGKISPGICMRVMANALQEALDTDATRKARGLKVIDPLIKGYFKDLTICT